jgi:hypothetical protein
VRFPQVLGKRCIIDSIALDISMDGMHHIITDISFFWFAGSCANCPCVNQASLFGNVEGLHPSEDRLKIDGGNSVQGNSSPTHATFGNL